MRIGFEKGSGDPVEVGLTHSVVGGITLSGKSETTQVMIQRAQDTILGRILGTIRT